MTEVEKDSKSEAGPSWREPLLAFAAVLVVLGAASLLASAWPPFSNHLLAVAAVLFIGLPFFILSRRGEDFHRFGIALDRIPARHVLFGLAVSAAVFPLFAMGNHFWETRLLERDFHPQADHYLQWPLELEAPSLGPGLDRTVQLRTAANQLRLEMSGPAEPSSGVLVKGDRPFRWTNGGNIHALHAPPTWFEHPDLIENSQDRPGVTADASTHWLVYPASTQSTGRLMISSIDQPADAGVPRQLEVQLPDRTAELWMGADAESAGEPVEIQRSYWWLILWALTHLILVALPEEYFYRGYLQTRFQDLLGRPGESPRRFLGFSFANWLTSAFFALGHILVPIGGAFVLARGAVFFPSLLFGWMRERTDSIVAPTIFHAASNMMVLVVAVHYF